MQPNSIDHQAAPREIDLYWLRGSSAAKENRHPVRRRLSYPLGKDQSGSQALPPLDPISPLTPPWLSGQRGVKGRLNHFTLFKNLSPRKKIWQIYSRLLEGELGFQLDKAWVAGREGCQGAKGPAAPISSGLPSPSAAPLPPARPGRLTPMWQEDVPQMTANRDVTGCPSQARPCPFTSVPITPVRKQKQNPF